MRLWGLLAELLIRAARPWVYRRYSEGNDERYGHFDDSLPRGALWIQAVSVGEVQSALSFIDALQAEAPQLPILLSTTTTTGKTMARQLLGNRVHHIYYPLDGPSVVRRALDQLAPLCFVTIETEIWPTMIAELTRRNIPAFLVNARLSDRSFKGYSRLKRFWQPVMNCYSMIMARSEEDRRRFIHIGVSPDRVCVTGDSKVDALMVRKKEASLPEELFLDERPVIVAGSTHDGEEALVLESFALLRKERPDLRLIVVPRHPKRTDDVMKLAASWKACLFSAPQPHWHVMVVDVIGQLLALYSLAEAAFVGGSLVPKGGQNVMEPTLWGVPFCQGPSYSDFTEATEYLLKQCFCRIVTDVPSLTGFFRDMLDETQRPDGAAIARGFFDHFGGSARRCCDLLIREVTQLNPHWRTENHDQSHQ